jgi:hypothetical protein
LITINSGITVTLNQDATIAGLTFAAPSADSGLIHSGGSHLTVNGNVTINQPSKNSHVDTWEIDAGVATVNGLISFLGGTTTTSRISQIIITSGQLNAFGGISFTGSASATKIIDMSGGAGQINLKGDLTIPANSCTLSAGTLGSVFNYMDDTAAQTIRYFTAGAYDDLYLNNTSAGGVTLSANKTATNATGDLRVQSGTFHNGGFSIVGGAGNTFEVAASAAFEMTGASAFPSGYATYLFAPNSTIRYFQTTASLTLSAQSYGNLELMPAATAVQNFPAGALTVQGNLSMGDGSHTTTVSANLNATALSVGGSVLVANAATFVANNANLLTVGGNWTNAGTFTAGTSTTAFLSSNAQIVDNRGGNFASLVSSNTSSGGLTFSSGFSAGKFTLNAAGLAASATVYFAGGSTFTVGSFNVNGTASAPIVLASTNSTVSWYLNNTSTNSVSYVQVSRSNASAGLKIVDKPGGVAGPNNVNWGFDALPPGNPRFTAATVTALSAAWDAPSYPGDKYTLTLSTNSNFSGTLISSTTANLVATTPSSLAINTTYYAHVNTLVDGSTSAWTTSIATATLSQVPSTAVSTWTAVNATSVTVTWAGNGNPAGTTLYVVQLSSMSNFLSGDIYSDAVYALTDTVDQLESGVVYYARVKSVNHSGIGSAYVNIGSTKTVIAAIPKNFAFSAATTNSLSATWAASTPAGDSYNLGVSTDANFGGTLTSSNTANLFATTPLTLSPNTTYYGHANAVVGGVSGAWSTPDSRATLANAPASAASTWTAVNFTSVTIAWSNNGNPLALTRYTVQLSTVANFGSGAILSDVTTSLSDTFASLSPSAIYFARVQAVNHSGVATGFVALGSTQTLTPLAPAGLQIASIQISSMSVSWNASIPAGDSYTLQVSTQPGFGGTPISSTTASLSATVVGLSPNVVYYERVKSVVSGASSPWSASITTVTLVNAPTSAAGTWTLVGQSSARVAWADSINPPGVTLYRAELSDAPDFSTNLVSSTTASLFATLASLQTGTVYYGRVLAINQGGAESGYLDLGSTQTVSATVCNATTSGNWSSAGTWTNCTGAGGLPNTTDAITINSGVVVTLDQNATIAGLIFAAPTVNSGLIHSGNFGLAVNGDVTFNQPTKFSPNDTWSINAGSATVTGEISFKGTNTTTTRISRIVITSGQLNVWGGMSFDGNTAATKIIDMSGGAGVLNLKGALTMAANSCTLSPGTIGSVFNYADDVSAQTVRFFPAGAYDNLYLNNTSAGGATLGADLTTTNTTGNVRVQSGTFDTGGFAVGGGAGTTLEVADGTVFAMSGTSSFPTGFGTMTLGSNSTVRYLQIAASLTINAQSYGNLELAPPATVTQNFPAGAMTVQGNLSIGDGSHYGTISADANATALQVNGSVNINALATFVANHANALTVEGNWTNAGTFSAGVSTVQFASSNAQTVDNRNGSFATLISSNVSSAGLTFSSGFNAGRFILDTNGLAAAATVYFAGNATFGIATFAVNGTSAYPVVLNSTDTNTSWYLNNTSTNNVSHVQVARSNASGGLTISDKPGGTTGGNNVNWIFDVLPPNNIRFTAATAATLSAAWDAPSFPGDKYTLTVSTDSNFGGTLVSSRTANLSATTPASLSPNTTYYGELNTIIANSTSAWSTSIATATLANAPATAASTWTAVHATSVTVSWAANGNPAGVTLYTVQLSSVSNFLSGDVYSDSVYALSDVVTQLESGVTYYARVQAINHSGIKTTFVNLGSTKTVAAPVPKNFAFTASSVNSLSASWTASTPSGDSYNMQVSTTSDFSGTLVTSNTANVFATTPLTLSPNTTYYGHVNVVVAGVPGVWSTPDAMSTRAQAPASSASTWTAVNFTSVTVAWSNNGNPLNATSYTVQLSTVSGFGSGTIWSNITTNLFNTFVALTPTARYYARVKATNNAGIDTTFATLGSTVTFTPFAPTGFTLTSVQISSTTVGWNDAVPSGDSYLVQASSDASFNGTLISSTTAALSADMVGLSPNTTYFERVRSVVSGSTSPWSITLSTITLAQAPETPGAIWTYVGQSSITVAWADSHNPAGRTSYRAELSDSPDFSTNLVSSTTAALSATLDTLLTGTVYYGRVLAINQVGTESSYLNLGSTQTYSPTTCNATVTGNWSASGTWSACTGAGGLPSPTDAVIVNSGVTLTLDQNATVAGLTFAAAGSNSALTHSGTFALTVNGPVSFVQPTSNNHSNSWNINAGSAIVAGLISFNGTNTTTSRKSNIVITSGQLNAWGGITFAASAAATKNITMSGGAGRLNLKGNLNIPANSCTLTAGTSGSVFNYMDNVSAQTVRFFSAGAYDHLYLNNTGAGATLSAAVTASNVTGDLRVQSGVFNTGGFAVAGASGGTFAVSNGATFAMSGTSAFPTGFTTITLSSASTVRYLQITTPLTIDARTYGNLDLMPPATITQNFPAGAMTVQGNLSVGDGSHAATVSADANATTLQVNGSLTIAAAATFIANSAQPLTIGKDWNDAGTFNANAQTVMLSGAAVHALTGSTAFYALRTVTAGATVQFAAGSTTGVTNLVEFQNIVLRSDTDGSAWFFDYTGSSQTLKNISVKDSDASGGSLMQAAIGSIDLGNNVNWDFGPPSAIANAAATPSAWGGTIDLAWQTPGDDGSSGVLNGTFVIQYTSNTSFAQSAAWDPSAAEPGDVYRVTIATNIAPAVWVSTSIGPLSAGDTYYFRLWTRDDVGNYSRISNGATNYATPINLSVRMSTDTLSLGALTAGAVVVLSAPIVVTNIGNVTETYEFNAATMTAGTPWHLGTSQAMDQFVLWMGVGDTQPSAGDFGAEDILSNSSTRCTSTALAIGSATCVSVPPGETRTVWFKFGVPPVVSNNDDQSIRVTATATTPD